MSTTTITVGATVLTLDHPLLWEDEFGWEPVVQTRRTTVTGAQNVQAQAMLAGRPVTLASGGWVRRSQLLQLQAWREQPGLVLQVSPRGGTPMSVTWDTKGGALQADMVQPWAFPEDGELYRVRLRFFTV
ncbi:MAG: hypothetical protein KF683_11405 [Rubrivivax sp.]|nr:hypothetical protein [Rubrivivax sp.]